MVMLNLILTYAAWPLHFVCCLYTTPLQLWPYDQDQRTKAWQWHHSCTLIRRRLVIFQT